ncbi:hypothetical protein [Haladaptatus caseinilyticus]|uniref:hypothetical protein n=1 Tax=Haladaptatus caseinilyticus TaxID=2993314 RepID=UPI00224B5A32|nr:hypothetical protein [Haladaptatus caseinilyticus]
MKGRTLSLLLLILVAGCAGGPLNGPGQPSDTAEQKQKLQFVVQNDASSTEKVRITFTSNGGKTALNRSQTLDSGEVWVVSTVNVSSLNTPVKVTARLPKRGYSTELAPIRSTERGSRLHTVTEDGIDLFECNSNTTCWKQEVHKP